MQYGAYHHNSTNVAIHIACVPLILLTFLVLFTNEPWFPSFATIHVPIPATLHSWFSTSKVPPPSVLAAYLPSWLSPLKKAIQPTFDIPLNLGVLVALVFSFGYLLLEPLAGALLSPVLIATALIGSRLTSSSRDGVAFYTNVIAIALNIFSWVAQFIGHGVYEGRKPALLDNIIQAFFLAPLFVFLEVLFMFGYRPELQQRVDTAVHKEVKLLNKKANGRPTTNGKSK